MDNSPFKNTEPNSLNNRYEDIFSNKNTIILILILLLFAGTVGVDLLRIVFNFLEIIGYFLLNIVYYILNLLGYTTGTVIIKTADVLGDSAKFGVDIAEGTAHDIGNILKNSTDIEDSINTKHYENSGIGLPRLPEQCTPAPPTPCTPSQCTPAPPTPCTPKPDNPENPIQKPISANKTNWCLVGEYQQKRGCIEIDSGDKCISGQSFPTKEKCLQMK
jgi:hypothetical protein